jgi:alpha-glucosidase
VPLTRKTSNHLWWRQAVFYQIYPLSFADSNGDGHGDLQGIVSKLDYLSETLGVDAIWISPFFKSPMRDWGYDVSDHCDVDPMFGNLADAEQLIAEAHERGLKVIIDYVLNHTSDQHPWFLESSSSKDNPKRDWYVWRDGRHGGPPNNWVSVFSGPAWTYHEDTGQWYRHTYLSEQPDLNWRNPEVVEAMMGVARFWMDLGVDGFRVDAAHQMMKDPDERDNPPAPSDYPRPWKDMGEYDEYIHLYDFGHPDVHEAHRRFREVVDSYERDVVTVGEIHIFDLPEWASYYGEHLDQLHMPFNFHLMASEWNVPSLRGTIEAVLWNVPVGGWTNWTLGNHDEIRLASRLPSGHDRLAALLLLTLRGSPFLYYGDELGMHESKIADELQLDPWGRRVATLSRDGARTPMHWSGEPNAGFSVNGSVPWLPIGDDHETVNVQTQLDDPGSTLNMYRRLLALRSESVALRLGSFLAHPASTDEILVYRREADHQTMTVALNFSRRSQSVSLRRGRVVFSTLDPDRDEAFKDGLELAPLEGVVVNHPYASSAREADTR